MKIVFFARARELAQRSEWLLDEPGIRTTADVRKALARAMPALASLLEKCQLAVNGEFAGPDALVADDAEVAVLPPVSGG